jgi:hypothetical protein
MFVGVVYRLLAGHEIPVEAVCTFCNEFLPDISVLSAKRRNHRDAGHPEYENKYIRF